MSKKTNNTTPIEIVGVVKIKATSKAANMKAGAIYEVGSEIAKVLIRKGFAELI